MTVYPGLVEQQLGDAAVTLTIAGVAVPGDAIGPVTINRGRRGIDARPEAATLSTVVDRSALAVLPEIGDVVTVDLTDAALDYFAAGESARPRFRGRVTDEGYTPAAVTRTGSQVAVVAVGPRSRLRQLPTDVAVASATDGQQAGALLDQAAMLDPDIVRIPGSDDAGTVTLVPIVADANALLSLLDEIAVSSGGEVVELRDGSLAWRDAATRLAVPPAVELTTANVIAEPLWRKNLVGMVNDLTLTYGENDPQDTYRLADSWSVEQPWGELAATLTTRLATLDDAVTRASDVVGRRGRPVWRIDGLTVELLRTVDPNIGEALLDADFGTLLAVSGFPDDGPYPDARLWIEGTTETIERDSWTLRAYVTDYGATGAGPSWTDAPAWTWATVPAGRTWLSMRSYYPGD